MKKQFSNKWNGSKKPRKQRKFRATSPLHVKRKLISSHLSKELRKKHGKRAMPARKGDSVKIMKGAFAGKSGKIEKVDSKKMKVYIESMQISKKDGSKVSVPFDASNLLITEIAEDKNRTIIKENKTGEKK